MSGKVLVIGEPELVTAYRMLGCETLEASTPAQLLEELEKNSARGDVSIILLSQELSEPVRDEVDRIIEKSGKIISYLPTLRKRGEPVDLRKMMLRALGFG